MTDWVRLWHDMPTDPKWRTIARKSGQRVGDVIAVFNFVLVNASGNATERGRTQGLSADDIGAAIDLEEADVQAILDAMKGKVLSADGSLLGWQKRQPKREDSTAAARKAAWKERSGTQRNARERPETETETEEEDTLAEANGASAAPDQVFWANAKAFVAPETKGDPGKLIGAWCRDHGKDETALAITRAQLERPAQRVPFIIGCLKQAKQEGGLRVPC